MNLLNPQDPATRYAEQLARVATPSLIDRMKSAGLDRATRRRLISLSRKGDLRGHHFPAPLIYLFMAVGDGAFDAN